MESQWADIETDLKFVVRFQYKTCGTDKTNKSSFFKLGP